MGRSASSRTARPAYPQPKPLLLASFGVTAPLDVLLRTSFPDATEISVTDRTGGGDHFQVTVVSPSFDGLTLVEQHRLVYDALAEQLADGTIHELRITTRGGT